MRWSSWVFCVGQRRYASAEIRHADENAKLSDDYRRVLGAFHSLQAKYKRFQTAETLKYQKVRSLDVCEVPFAECASKYDLNLCRTISCGVEANAICTCRYCCC